MSTEMPTIVAKGPAVHALEQRYNNSWSDAYVSYRFLRYWITGVDAWFAANGIAVPVDPLDIAINGTKSLAQVQVGHNVWQADPDATSEPIVSAEDHFNDDWFLPHGNFFEVIRWSKQMRNGKTTWVLQWDGLNHDEVQEAKTIIARALMSGLELALGLEPDAAPLDLQIDGEANVSVADGAIPETPTPVQIFWAQVVWSPIAVNIFILTPPLKYAMGDTRDKLKPNRAARLAQQKTSFRTNTKPEGMSLIRSDTLNIEEVWVHPVEGGAGKWP
jgi:hypothetical protein